MTITYLLVLLVETSIPVEEHGDQAMVPLGGGQVESGLLVL